MCMCMCMCIYIYIYIEGGHQAAGQHRGDLRAAGDKTKKTEKQANKQKAQLTTYITDKIYNEHT